MQLVRRKQNIVFVSHTSLSLTLVQKESFTLQSFFSIFHHCNICSGAICWQSPETKRLKSYDTILMLVFILAY